MTNFICFFTMISNVVAQKVDTNFHGGNLEKTWILMSKKGPYKQTNETTYIIVTEDLFTLPLVSAHVLILHIFALVTQKKSGRVINIIMNTWFKLTFTVVKMSSSRQYLETSWWHRFCSKSTTLTSRDSPVQSSWNIRLEISH